MGRILSSQSSCFILKTASNTLYLIKDSLHRLTTAGVEINYTVSECFKETSSLKGKKKILEVK